MKDAQAENHIIVSSRVVLLVRNVVLVDVPDHAICRGVDACLSDGAKTA